MPRWMFWGALWLACVAGARVVTPGVPEAVGFAAPAVLAAALVAWFARDRPARARHMWATAAAAGLLLGAMTGVLGEQRHVDQLHAYEVAAAPAA